MYAQQLDLFEFIEVEEFPVDQGSEVQKKKGRPPLTVNNPLDNTPASIFMTPEGLPVIWLDDILTGASRTVGLKDQRATTKAPYVSMKKVVKVLLLLPGKLTPKRVSEALKVSHDTAWRIVSVIDVASVHIERVLKADSRVREYRVPNGATTGPL